MDFRSWFSVTWKVSKWFHGTVQGTHYLHNFQVHMELPFQRKPSTIGISGSYLIKLAIWNTALAFGWKGRCTCTGWQTQVGSSRAMLGAWRSESCTLLPPGHCWIREAGQAVRPLHPCPLALCTAAPMSQSMWRGVLRHTVLSRPHCSGHHKY